MKKFNELNIKINKARITDIDVSFSKDSDTPAIRVAGKLVTESGIDISSFSFSTDGWDDKTKFTAPLTVHSPIRKLFDELTPIIYEKMNGMVKLLEEENNKKEDDDDSFGDAF